MTFAKRKYSQDPEGSELPNKRSCTDDHDPEPIQQFSSDQRLAVGDEPICYVCGKYGEYINNDTDQDVCSFECKKINTDLNSHRPKHKTPPTIVGHIHDYVASHLHAKLTNYQEPISIAKQSKEAVQHMLKAHDITLKGTHIPKPFTTYDQLAVVLGETLLANIESMHWSMATSIQRQAVTIGLAGRDIMAIAPTRSGKTGAFLIPILTHCISLSKRDDFKRRYGPYALIMAPTREICIQIENICKELATGLCNMRTGLLIGGEPLPNQIHRLKKGVQIIIGTPGRILDVATHHASLLRIGKISMLVLDEVDTMFGLGFGTQVKQIMAKVPESRQTMYFSATLSDDKLMKSLFKRLKAPIEIQLGQQEQAAINKLPQPSDQVRQTILWVDNKSKAKRLFSILRDPKYFIVPVLIFVASRLGAEFLTRAIKKKFQHLKIMSMHGDKTQEERAMIIQGLNQPEPLWDLVVTTDVLARGIDLPFVKLVINYDMASTLDDYVHRIGRAILQKPLPRNTKQERGWSITFINQEHQQLLEPLAKMLSTKPSSQVTPLPSQLKRLL